MTLWLFFYVIEESDPHINGAPALNYNKHAKLGDRRSFGHYLDHGSVRSCPGTPFGLQWGDELISLPKASQISEMGNITALFYEGITYPLASAI
jgi:hypothetical protein